jgi:RNA polymerase sigma factor (TIGR02999 family)
MSDATLILMEMEQGRPEAAEKLLELVYEELRRLAASRMANELPGHTLQPTALVHEAWLRLLGANARFENRAHFFAAAAEAMRRILIERARHKLRQRYGGGFQRIELDAQDFAAPDSDQQILAINEALDKFAQAHPIKAEVVKLRYFAGMTSEETANIMGLSVATVKNYWKFARAWIFREIKRM